MFGSKKVDALEKQVQNLQSELARVAVQIEAVHTKDVETLVASFDKVAQRISEAQRSAQTTSTKLLKDAVTQNESIMAGFSERVENAMKAICGQQAEFAKQGAALQEKTIAAQKERQCKLLDSNAVQMDKQVLSWQRSCETMLKSLAETSDKMAKEVSARQEKFLQLHAQALGRQEEVMKTTFCETTKQLSGQLMEIQSKNLLDYATAQGVALMAVDQARENRAAAKLEEERTEERKRRVAYALNACMVSVSQIVDYQDVNVLQQEYDALLNNLNLENFPKDEALLNALKKILDVCHFYILHAKDKEMLKKKQARRLKDALGKSLSGGNVIAIFGNANPYALAAGVVAMVGIAAVRYKSERDKAKLENELEEWQLEKSALEQLHNLRRTLFETAWRLSDRYEYPEEWRLTERQIKMYNEALAEHDPLKRYWNLDQMKGWMGAYPLFWYYLGRAAMETAEAYRPHNLDGESETRFRYPEASVELYNRYRDFARRALEGNGQDEEGFLKAHGGKSLLREDVLSAAAYLDCASLHEGKPDKMFEYVKMAHQLSGLDLEINQSCAFRSLHILDVACKEIRSAGEKRKEMLAKLAQESFLMAEKTLKLLVHQDFNVEINGRALSKLYIAMSGRATKKEHKSELKKRYDVLRACISHTRAFPYQWIFPWDETSLKNEWTSYLNGEGLRRTVFNYFYGRFRCVYQEFYKALGAAGKAKDLSPVRLLKEGKPDWSDKYNVKVTKIEDLNGNDPFRELHKCYWIENVKPDGLDGVVQKILIDGCKQDANEKPIEKELQLIHLIKSFIFATSERRLITLGLYRHDTDYSENLFKEEVKGLEGALVVYVTSLTRAFAKEFARVYGESAKSSWEHDENPEVMKLVCHLESEAENYRKCCVPQEGRRVFVYPEPEPAKLGCKSADNTNTDDIFNKVPIPNYEMYDGIDWDEYVDEFPRT